MENKIKSNYKKLLKIKNLLKYNNNPKLINKKNKLINKLYTDLHNIEGGAFGDMLAKAAEKAVDVATSPMLATGANMVIPGAGSVLENNAKTIKEGVGALKSDGVKGLTNLAVDKVTDVAVNKLDAVVPGSGAIAAMAAKTAVDIAKKSVSAEPPAPTSTPPAPTSTPPAAPEPTSTPPAPTSTPPAPTSTPPAAPEPTSTPTAAPEPTAEPTAAPTAPVSTTPSSSIKSYKTELKNEISDAAEAVKEAAEKVKEAAENTEQKDVTISVDILNNLQKELEKQQENYKILFNEIEENVNSESDNDVSSIENNSNSIIGGANISKMIGDATNLTKSVNSGDVMGAIGNAANIAKSSGVMDGTTSPEQTTIKYSEINAKINRLFKEDYLIVYLFVSLFNRVFRKGYNIKKHINDIYVSDENLKEQFTKTQFKYELKKREYLLLKGLEDRKPEDDIADIINNVKLSDLNKFNEEETIIDVSSKISSIATNIYNLISKMKDKEEDKYTKAKDKIIETDKEFYEKDENEKIKLENILEKEFKYNLMYNFDNNAGNIVALLLMFIRLRRNIKKVSHLSDLMDFNNINIKGLDNIAYSNTRSLKSFKKYIENNIIENNDKRLNRDTIKYLRKNIVFFNKRLYNNIENISQDVLENLNVLNKLMKEHINIIKNKLDDLKLDTETEDLLLKDVDIISNGLLTSNNDVNKIIESVINKIDIGKDVTIKKTRISSIKETKINILLEYGINRTKLLVINKKIRWYKLNLFIIKVLFKLFSTEEFNYAQNIVKTIQEHIIEETENINMVPPLIKFDPIILKPKKDEIIWFYEGDDDERQELLEKIKGNNMINADELLNETKLKNKALSSLEYTQSNIYELEDLDKILFEYQIDDTMKALNTTKDTFINDTLFWFYEIDTYKLYLNENKIHLLQIFKTKLIDIIKTYYWNKIKDIHTDLYDDLTNALNELDASNNNDEEALTKIHNNLIIEYENNKTAETQKYNTLFNKKIKYINDNSYFEYLVNMTLIKEKNNPINIDFEYNENKTIYNKLLEELLSFIENDINFNKGKKNSFMEFIVKLTENDTIQDLNETISKLELMHYIEQSDYLKLLTKYSKLNDIFIKLNSIENQIGLPTTNKPIILIVIENLFINNRSNINNDIQDNNISIMQQGFSGSRNNIQQTNSQNNSNMVDNFINNMSSNNTNSNNINKTNKPNKSNKKEDNIVFFKQLNGSLVNPSNFIRGDTLLIKTNKKKK